MADLDKALATQLGNIEKRTGKSVAELIRLVQTSALVKHSELVAMLKDKLSMGHGDANTLVHLARKADEPAAATADEPLDGLYIDKKAALKPLHQQLVMELNKLGDYETAPKKAYISYRRNKQFCMIGPATATAVEIGLNVKNLPASERLKPLPAGQMCNYKVRLTASAEIDAELLGWLKAAYDAAG